MPDDNDELDLTEEFEWALKDPTEEKIAELGEVVSIITNKLIAAISDVQKTVYELQQQVDSIESNVDNLKARGVAAPSSPSAAAASPSPAASAAPDMAKAPKPKAAAAPPPGPGGMMGELKALLAARRKKVEGAE